MELNALARMAMESFLRKRFCFSCCRNATSGSALGNFSKTNRFCKNLECTAGIASEACDPQAVFVDSSPKLRQNPTYNLQPTTINNTTIPPFSHELSLHSAPSFVLKHY